VSGPTIVGRFGPALRGVLAAVLTTVVVVGLGLTVLHSDRSAAPLKPAGPATSTSAANPVSVEAATLRTIPAPGTTGAATCTDPTTQQEWRVSWRAIATSASTATATPALTPSTRAVTPPAVTSPAAEPTTSAPAAPGPSGSATPSPSGSATPGPSGSPVPSPFSPSPADTALQAELAAKAAAVTLIPTGFAVRSLNPDHPDPTATPTATTGAAETATGVPTIPATATASPTAAPTPAGPALPGGWQSRDLDRWLLRWTPTPAEAAVAVRTEEWVRMGPLATLAALPMTALQDPRFVTTDGACTVYLLPFRGPVGADTDNTVAVIGDSLVAQLYGSSDRTPASTGPLLDRLVAQGDRAEISGQGGRRWGVKPDGLSSLEQADSVLLDELRGLREARSVVVALGTNDAGWVAHSTDREQYELRLAWVMTHLAPILDELRDHGHCTVLVTMAERNKSYGGSAPGTFDVAARQINDYLRTRANADPDDRLKLWDWGAHADPHGHLDPDPWFDNDTIHLKPSGFAHYADELTAASKLC
jgi:lysophospholipase L1-like esterase